MNLHHLVKKYCQKSHYKRSKQDHKNVYFAALEKNPDSYFCMVIDGKIFEKGFISESKFSNESTPTGQKILPKVPL